MIKIDTSFSIVNEDNQNLLGGSYNKIIRLPNECFAVRDNARWLFATSSGTEILESIHIPVQQNLDELPKCVLCSYSKKCVCIFIEEKWYFLMSEGKLSDPYEKIDILHGNSELVAVKTETGWGLADKNGQLVTLAIYDKFEYFTYGNSSPIIAKLNGKYGFISAADKKQLGSFIYDSVNHFHDFVNFGGPVSEVCIDDKWGLLTFNSKCNQISVVVDCDYDEIVLKSFGVLVRNEDKWGLYDFKGHKVLDCIFSGIEIMHNYAGFLKVYFDSKVGIYTISGDKVVAPCYDKIINLSLNTRLALLRREDNFVLYELYKHEVYNKQCSKIENEDAVNFFFDLIHSYLHPVHF